MAFLSHVYHRITTSYGSCPFHYALQVLTLLGVAASVGTPLHVTRSNNSQPSRVKNISSYFACWQVPFCAQANLAVPFLGELGGLFVASLPLSHADCSSNSVQRLKNKSPCAGHLSNQSCRFSFMSPAPESVVSFETSSFSISNCSQTLYIYFTTCAFFHFCGATCKI